MKKDEISNFIRKTVCLDSDTLSKIEELAKKDNRKFSPFVALKLKEIANEPL